jgi:hypothetical protein
VLFLVVGGNIKMAQKKGDRTRGCNHTQNRNWVAQVSKGSASPLPFFFFLFLCSCAMSDKKRGEGGKRKEQGKWRCSPPLLTRPARLPPMPTTTRDRRGAPLRRRRPFRRALPATTIPRATMSAPTRPRVRPTRGAAARAGCPLSTSAVAVADTPSAGRGRRCLPLLVLPRPRRSSRRVRRAVPAASAPPNTIQRAGAA